MSRILLVEDHEAFRRSLALLLDWEPELEVVAQARSLEEARRDALESLREVDVAVVDLLLSDGNGMELVREMRQAKPDLPVVVLSIVRDPKIHDWASAMGADEVVSKDAPLEEIIVAIRRLGADA